MWKNHDQSACKWSAQTSTGYCPYKEIYIRLFNDVSPEKKNCKDRACLNILLETTGASSEAEGLEKLGRTDLLKPRGPHSHDLLNNFNIDNVLHDLAMASVSNSTLFPNGPMYHVPYVMYDFHRMPGNELWDLSLDELVQKGFKTFACVLNTDTYAGAGKHWVCIFGTHKADGKWDVEYFNSSSNGLEHFSTLGKWIEHKRALGANIDISECVFEPLQWDDESCGIWCLIFIKSRLEGHDANWMKKFNDNDMFEARRYLFTPN